MADSPETQRSIDAHVAESLMPEAGLEDFLEQNFGKIWKTGLAALLIAAIYGFWSSSQHEALVNAAVEATKAKTPEDCDLVIQHHPGTVAAGNALLTKAALLWNQNKKDSAVETLRKFERENVDHPLFAQALLSLASRLDSMGKTADAEPIYQRLRKDFPNSGTDSVAQLRLVDNLLAAGKTEEAKGILESFAKNFQGATAAIEGSNERLKWLTAGLPTKEVDPPPAPKVEAPKVEAPKDGAAKITPPAVAPIKLTSPVVTPPSAPVTVKPVAPPAGVTTPPVSPTTAPAAPVAPATSAPAAPASGQPK
jgi:predicted negative regulator of RcsB-dependent stress response